MINMSELNLSKLKTISVYGLFASFIVSIPVITYIELFFSLGLEAQFALGLAYLVIFAGLFYYISSSRIYNKHSFILAISLFLLVLLSVTLSI